MTSKHKLSANQRSSIPAEYEAGASTTKLAAQYDVSTRTIRNILTTAGTPMRRAGQPFKLTTTDDSAIAAEYASGIGSAELAARYGVYPATIRRAITRTGTPLRLPGPSNTDRD